MEGSYSHLTTYWSTSGCMGVKKWKELKCEKKRREELFSVPLLTRTLQQGFCTPSVCVGFFFFFFFFHPSACQEFLACRTMKANRTGLNRHPGSRRTHQVQLRSGGGTHCDLRHPGPQTTGKGALSSVRSCMQRESEPH